MFTGIIVATGKINRIENRGVDRRYTIHSLEFDFASVTLGDSIAVNGVCLTAVEISSDSFAADVSAETLSCTTFNRYVIGTVVNLEPALSLSTRLGGHLVSGHVDGVGDVVEIKPDGRSYRYRLKAPDRLAKYIAEKGSICVDGVSLTVNRVEGAFFDVNIVPHTLEKTVIANYTAGTQVNLEVDLIARYLERLMLGDRAAQVGASSSIDESFLAEHGFLKGAR